ncbi:MAG: BtpA/SgcQ family protein [Velocimicrobium sp.]
MSKELIYVGAKTVIGMVHCLPLPGTSGFDGDYEKILEYAVRDAITLEKAGVNAIIVENMGDTPFRELLDKPQIVALTAAAERVRKSVQIPIGIDAAFNDCEASLSIAAMCGADFVRVPVFVDTVIFTDGIMNPCARKCVGFRKQFGIEHVKILADVQVKHTYMLNSGITIELSAKDAVSNGADALIVTGSVIGEETPIDLIKRVKNVVKVPVLAGSGINEHNIDDQLKIADGCIVGSSLKKDGILTNPIDFDLVHNLIKAVKL